MVPPGCVCSGGSFGFERRSRGGFFLQCRLCGKHGTGFRASGLSHRSIETGNRGAGSDADFLSGGGKVFGCSESSGKEAEVYDPLGLPGLVLDRPFLEKLIPAHGVYCIFPENSGTGKRLHPADLLHAGLGYRRRRRREEQEEMREAFASYQPGRANGLSLFWGTMNLAQKLTLR